MAERETPIGKWWKRRMGEIIVIAQWPVVRIVSGLLWLSDKRRTFSNAFAKLLKMLTAIGVSFLLNLAGWSNDSPGKILGIPSSMVWQATKAMGTSMVVLIILEALIPLAVYVPYAVAMRAMGLLGARIGKGVGQKYMDDCVTSYLKLHDDAQKIRVICISGHELFLRFNAGSVAPLKDYAEKGKIRALFPKSDQTNATIFERYDDYSPEFRQANYPKITDLIAEIDRSKEYLRSKGNEVIEHDELCMWRVVLLSEHCIVQNYFPNHSGCQSHLAPVFVFGKEGHSTYSYYDTFSEMFELLAKPRSNRASSPTGAKPMDLPTFGQRLTGF